VAGNRVCRVAIFFLDATYQNAKKYTKLP
jgi:hypothetical protein